MIAHSSDPGRMARLAYTYLHLPIVAGIVVSAVGDEFLLAHPDGHVDRETITAIAGGPAIYLADGALLQTLGHRPLAVDAVSPAFWH